MSNSGVLFQAETGFSPRTNIEIELTLPVVLPGRPAAKISGRGTVVRSLQRTEAGPGFMVAAAIQSRRFVTNRGELELSANNARQQ